MMYRTQAFIFGLTLMFSFGINTSCNVKKGYESLTVYDYFNAKKHLQKGRKYNPSPSSFGLANIYYRHDNPFHNLDSAYHYILEAESTWEQTKETKKQKWKIYGWSDIAIDSLKNLISNEFYRIAKEKMDTSLFTKFIKEHPWSDKIPLAIHQRDSLAFFDAVYKNTSNAYKNFLDIYPESEYKELALQNYHHSLFIENVSGGTIDDFALFIKRYPDSPYKKEADSMIYILSTRENTIQSYLNFIQRFPKNSFYKRAWRELYNLYIGDEYTEEKIRSFLHSFQNTPISDEIKEELNRFHETYLPFIETHLYGLMNLEGESILSPLFHYIGAFEEGLSIVVKDAKYGLINKQLKIQVPHKYDGIMNAPEGRFIVEQNDFLGLIDRNGKELLMKLDEIGEIRNNLPVYVSKNDTFYYVDLNGHRLSQQSFSNANDYQNFFAIVETVTGEGIIDTNFQFVLQPRFKELKYLGGNFYRFADSSGIGVLNISGDTIIPAKYDYISHYHDSLFMVSKSDSLFYLNSKGINAFQTIYSTFPNYQEKALFYNGIAIAVLNDKYGRINTKGNVVTPFDYENIGFGENVFPFKKDGLWGILSKLNKIIVGHQYDAADLQKDGTFLVRLGDSLGVISGKGETIVPIQYQSIDMLFDSVYKIFNGTNYGVYQRDRLLFDCSLENVDSFDKNKIILTEKGYIYYYDLKNNRLIRRKDE